jgi:beta-1,4-N-acetylglucosaminyltransferase
MIDDVHFPVLALEIYTQPCIHQHPRRTMAEKTPGRRCFVTVGATAGFRQLLDEISSPAFLRTIADLQYEALEIQCGPDFDWLQGKVQALDDKCGIKITCLQYTNNMKDHMLQCRGETGTRLAGCVISHAGNSNS